MMSEYMNKELFEQDVRGFLFYNEKTLDGTERSKMIFDFTKEALYKLREGDLVAVESFTNLAPHEGGKCYTLLEVLSLSPTHITIDRLKKYKFMGAVREFLKESTKDFEEDDTRVIRDHVYIEATAEPTGYLMKVSGNNVEFIQEPSKPILGRDVGLLKANVLKQLINKDVKDGIVIGELFSNFSEKRIPILIRPHRMITHHFSIFGFTGSGKSNFNSVLITRLLDNQQLKVVVFDLSDEYTSLLIDKLLSKGIALIDENDMPESVVEYLKTKSKGATTEELKEQLETASKELAETSKKPGVYDSPDFVPVYQKLFKELLKKDRIRIFRYVPSEIAIGIFTVQDFFDELADRATDYDKRHIKNMIDFFPTVCEEMGVEYNENYSAWDIDSIPNFCELIRKLRVKAGIKDTVAFNSSIEAILTSIERSRSKREGEETEETPEAEKETHVGDFAVGLDWVIERFVEQSEGELNLCIIVSSEKNNLIAAMNYVITRSLEIRRRGTKKHSVLFVVDEGHEFVINPRETGTSKEEKESSRIIERLTRMGRKYGLGVCIASQRVAHLNTTAISNCHTTFIGSLPRSYDRNTMNEAYAVSQDILNQVVTFPPGNWYVVSMIATGIKNVPIRIVAPNREKELAEFFKSKRYLSNGKIKLLKSVNYL
jgi:hypothetical protein